MARQPTVTDEIQALKDAIRQGHELLQELKDATRDARRAQADVVNQFGQVANREILDLSRQLQAGSDRAAAELNQEVARARKYIVHLLTISKLRYELDSGQLIIEFPAGGFDDQVQVPQDEKLSRKEAT